VELAFTALGFRKPDPISEQAADLVLPANRL
jgi:hypothetical protein